MSYTNLMLTNRNLSDLNPLIAGEEICEPEHSFGPAVRKYTLIHYVVKGEGTLYARGEVFPVKAGQAFLILPDETTTYIASSTNPWHYRWIGFNGRLADRFTELSPVFAVAEGIFPAVKRINTSLPEYQLAAILFQLYAFLFSPASGSQSHVRRVENYIQTAYMHPLRVEDIAGQLNLDRRYLSRLFKQTTGESIQDYLVRIRLQESTRYLAQGFSVQESAALCGYEDVSNFSRMFKRRYGISPTHWKQQH